MQSTTENKTFLFTDGACSGNPGKGGWAAIIKVEKEKTIKKMSGAYTLTTNNRMELMSLIKGLENIEDGANVDFFSDSQYIVSALTKGWLSSWQRNGWKTANKKSVANIDLWEQVLAQLKRVEVIPTWVRGHDGHKENEECDKMAVDAIANGPFERDEGYAKPAALF